MSNQKSRESKCSFCGISQGDAIKLIAGPNVFICDECTRTAYNLIFKSKEAETPAPTEPKKLPSPKVIKEKLDQYIISQDLAKKKLKHVYVGNAYIEGTSNTYCPSCSNVLISREGYHTNIAGIKDHKCSSCGKNVDLTL